MPLWISSSTSSGRLQVPGRRGHHAAFAQAGLQEYRRGVRADGRGQRVDVAVRDEADIHPEGLERLPDGGLARQRQRAHGPAVEAVLRGDDHRPVGPGMPPDQLERGLVGLGAGVGQEHPAVGLQQAEQPLGQLHLPLVQEQVRGVNQPPGLLGDRRDDRRVRMAEGADGDPADQVQVLGAVDVPDDAAPAVIERDGRHAVGAHDGRGVPLLQLLGSGPGGSWRGHRASGGRCRVGVTGPPSCRCPSR
jgi:hypothetical protein